MLMLNRMAILVTAKQPFLDWLRAVDPTNHELTLDEVNHEPAVYLLPECGDDEEVAAHIWQFCPEIFANELDGWWRRQSDWPRRRTPELFEQWFGWRYHSVVLDLAKEPLVLEAA
jgi:hypothetical protein